MMQQLLLMAWRQRSVLAVLTQDMHEAHDCSPVERERERERALMTMF